MRRIENILFDLDGTLTDPVEGIANCVRHSLASLNLPSPPAEEIASYIGPPLRQTFAAMCQSSDKELIERAITIYRQRLSTIGLFENRVYAGVPEMLAALRSNGCRLFVATSKPQVYAERILEHYALDSYFVRLHGNDLDGRLDDKAQMLSELISEHGLLAAETIMVGDRKHDVVAARKNGVIALGVTYGYGSEEELTVAGADYVCHSPSEIVTCIDDIRASKAC